MNSSRLIIGQWLLFINVVFASFATAAGLETTVPPSPLHDDQHCNLLEDSPNDGPEAIGFASSVISIYFWQRENMLENQVKDWDSPFCVFIDGRPKMAALIEGFKAAFDSSQDWSKGIDRLNTLKREYPSSAFVAIAESQYWISYAWNARGNGYASSVTPDGWKLFQERQEKAEKILLDTKSYSADLPIWYDQMIQVQSALDRPADARDKTFLEGAGRYKTYYPIYFTMLNYLTPKWGGSWDTVDNFVKWSVDNTKDIDGNSMYSRLYWYAWGGLPEGEKLFKNTLASWPKMRKGFEDLMARHPKSKWNLNNFARFACEADDKKTFVKLRREIGNDVVLSAWADNPTLDLCEAKFGLAN